MVPRVRRLENQLAYSFELVELCGNMFNDDSMPDNDDRRTFTIRVDCVKVFFKKSEQDNSTVICYQRWFTDPRNGRRILVSRSIAVPGLSLKEAYDKWIDYNINRKGTFIRNLFQRFGHPIPNCNIEYVETYEVDMPALGNSTPLLPESTKVGRVIVYNEEALTNITIQNAPVVECETDYFVEELFNLKCKKLVIFNGIRPVTEIVAYCKKLQEVGRPVGFLLCVLQFAQYLNQLELALEGQKGRMNLRYAFILEIAGNPDLEIVITVEPEMGYDLLFEVVPRGTAVPSRKRRIVQRS